jgi:hypothetical protein
VCLHQSAPSPARSFDSPSTARSTVSLLGVIGVAAAEELAAVGRVGFEFALGGVQVVLEVAKARVVFALEVCGDVGLFEAHLADLDTPLD